jgi:hypothetical protein
MQRPPAGTPADERDTDLADRHQERTAGLGHDPAICQTCNPRPRTLGPVRTSSAQLRARAAGEPSDSPASVAYIGTPARQVAGQILSGDKYCAEIAQELADMLGRYTALMLADELIDAAHTVTATGEPL